MKKNNWRWLLSVGVLLWWVPTSAGVFLTDVDQAFERAKLEKKPILISFYGIWCPACNQLEEVVFESTAFVKSAKNFVLTKVDADAELSWSIKDRYHIGGYPTVLFVSEKGQEIYRIVGFRETREFVRTMNWVFDNRRSDLERACRGSRTENLWRCGFSCSEKGDDKCAGEVFAKVARKLQPKDVRLQFIKTYALKKSDAASKRAGFAELIDKFPGSPFLFLWAVELIESVGTVEGQRVQQLPRIRKVLEQYQTVLNHRNLSISGLVPTDVAQLRAEILEKIGDASGAREAWKEADLLLSSYAKQLPASASARGYLLERIGCLSAAKDYGAALQLSEQYRTRFPKEFTFHFRSAGLLKMMGRTDEAIKSARDAYAVSYGDNRIRTATLLIELLKVRSDKKGAKTVYDEILAQKLPDKNLDVRTHQYLKKLEEAWAGF